MTDTSSKHTVDMDSLTQLRDEIRVRLHLAQLDAKEKWDDLETQLASLEHRVATDGGALVEATSKLAKDLKQSLVEFRGRLGG